MAGRVTEFMQRGAMPIDPFEIGLWWWNLHVVFDRRVERTITADTKIDAGSLDQGFNRGFDQTWRRWGRRGCDLIG